MKHFDERKRLQIILGKNPVSGLCFLRREEHPTSTRETTQKKNRFTVFVFYLCLFILLPVIYATLNTFMKLKV